MPRDTRASQIARLIMDKAYSADTLRCIAYALEKIEAEGEIEIRFSEEVDINEGKGA
jgi:hypothetical protein